MSSDITTTLPGGEAAAPRDRSRRKAANANDARPAARGQIDDAAIATILELGFYRASSNEIARTANVSWGSIQYHFGTREGLLLAVVEELNQRFTTSVNQAHVSGRTLEERRTRSTGSRPRIMARRRTWPACRSSSTSATTRTPRPTSPTHSSGRPRSPAGICAGSCTMRWARAPAPPP